MARFSFACLFAFASACLAIALPNDLVELADNLTERDVCTSRTDTELIGDGAPLQIKKYIQVTEAIKCANAPTCEKSNEESETLEVSFSVTWSGSAVALALRKASPPGRRQRVQLSADTRHVSSRSLRTQNVRECNFQLCRNPAKKCEASKRMASPNSGNKGHYAECGYDDQCKDKGYTRWERPGGGGGCKLKMKRGEDGIEKRMLVC